MSDIQQVLKDVVSSNRSIITKKEELNSISIGMRREDTISEICAAKGTLAKVLDKHTAEILNFLKTITKIELENKLH